MKRATSLGVLFLTAILSCASTGVLAAPQRGPSGCPPSVDSTEYVCLTTAEARKLKIEKLDLQDQIISLREENLSLRRTQPSGLKRYLKPWASVGMEKGLNDGKYTGYATGGVTVGGRVNLWAGVWGSEPSVGIGWEW